MKAKANTYYIINQNIEKTDGLIPDFGPDFLGVYEVIRVIDQRILFLEAHLERFADSLRGLSAQDSISNGEIITSLQKTITLNKIQTGNIQFLLAIHKLTNSNTFLTFEIPHSYPSSLQYRNGVPVTIANAMRPNPGIKMQHSDLRQRINQLMEQEKVYEVIMLHPDGYITEGSRSNILMIRGNEVYSAQIGEILPGVTLQYIFEICQKINIPVNQKKIWVYDKIPFYATF
jgi:branched-chain amino acid aminotransferase